MKPIHSKTDTPPSAGGSTAAVVISNDILPKGIRSSIVRGVNGLDMHILQAGNGDGSAPSLLLLHGFPELAYSWRRIMLPLADAGYHVIAPDQRGYGRTKGWSDQYDTDLSLFRLPALVRDLLALLTKLNIDSVDAVIGHDFGSPVAAWSSLIRPDIFKSVVLMSAPFEGSPAFSSFPQREAVPPGVSELDAALSRLNPPRKHYQHYYSTPDANADMCNALGGMAAFLRAYFFYKSADWPGNKPERLKGWAAEELGRMPTYYIMNREQNMPESVASYLPSADYAQDCAWMTEADLKFFSDEFIRTGFQGGLNWYRCGLSPEQNDELRLFGGKAIEVPSLYIAGEHDWGIYQRPGGIDRMRHACVKLQACAFIPGAGHWVQQEQPEPVVSHLLQFLKRPS